MATRGSRAAQRTGALSRELIVKAATRILDDEGEDALTLRVLTARLHTGYGAIYHHVANKGEVLMAATDAVLVHIASDVAADAEPLVALRSVAAGLFDAIAAHPWVGAQLVRDPSQPALLKIYEIVGGRLSALGVAAPALFDAAGALMNYVLGVAGQNAANARRLAADQATRSDVLAAVAARWAELDPDDYPLMRQAAAQLQEHDDRGQFLAGVDLILAGVQSTNGAAVTSRTQAALAAGDGDDLHRPSCSGTGCSPSPAGSPAPPAAPSCT